MTQPTVRATSPSQPPFDTVAAPDDAILAARVAGGTNLAGQVAEPVANMLHGVAPRLADALTGTADVIDDAGPALSFVQHLFGDEPVVESATGAFFSATARTAIDSAVDRVTASVDPLGAVVVAADGMFDEDDAPKIFTTFARSAAPNAMLRDALYGAVDAAAVVGTAVTGDIGAAHRGADRVEDNALAGDYGVFPQVGTIALGLATSPVETSARVSDTDARTGERGVLLAWGNAAADLWDEALGRSSQPPRTIPVAEAERRAETFWGRWQ